MRSPNPKSNSSSLSSKEISKHIALSLEGSSAANLFFHYAQGIHFVKLLSRATAVPKSALYKSPGRIRV